MCAASIYTSITDKQTHGSWHRTQHDRQTPTRRRTAATVRSPRRPFLSRKLRRVRTERGRDGDDPDQTTPRGPPPSFPRSAQAPVDSMQPPRTRKSRSVRPESGQPFTQRDPLASTTEAPSPPRMRTALTLPRLAMATDLRKRKARSEFPAPPPGTAQPGAAYHATRPSPTGHFSGTEERSFRSSWGPRSNRGRAPRAYCSHSHCAVRPGFSCTHCDPARPHYGHHWAVLPCKT